MQTCLAEMQSVYFYSDLIVPSADTQQPDKLSLKTRSANKSQTRTSWLQTWNRGCFKDKIPTHVPVKICIASPKVCLQDVLELYTGFSYTAYQGLAELKFLTETLAHTHAHTLRDRVQSSNKNTMVFSLLFQDPVSLKTDGCL